MGGGWGASHNGVRIGCFWDGVILSADGSQARITNAHIKIDRDVNINDSSNKLSWSGGCITDGSDSNINLDGSGSKTIKNCTETWINLSYTGTVNQQFDATLTGCTFAGQNLYADESQTYPQRLYDLPVAPTNMSYTGTLGNFTVHWTNNSSANAPWTVANLYRYDYATGVATVVSIPSPLTATSIVQTVPATGRYYWKIIVGNARGNATSGNTAVTPTPLHTLTMSDSTPLIDQAITFTVNRNGSSYLSQIKVDGIITNVKTASTSLGYTFAQATWATRLSSVISKTLSVVLETYTADGVTLIGSTPYTLTLSLPTPLGVYAPTANVPTIADQTATIVTAFGAGTYIQNMSVLRVTHSGASGVGSTITKKEVIVNGSYYDVTIAGYVDIPVTWATSPTAQSRTTDTRGQIVTSATTIVKGYPYAKPVILNFTTQRVDGSGNPTGSGTQIKFTVNVSASSIFNVSEQNTMKFDVYLADSAGAPVGGVLYTKAANSTLITSPASVSGVIGVGPPTDTYSKSASYSFVLVVNDDLAASTVTRLSSIPTEIVPLSIGPNGIAVGKVYDDTTKAVDIVGNTLITGDLTVTGAVSFAQPDAILPTRLGQTAKLITDWNAAVENGWYRANGATNAPVAATWFIGEVIVHDSSYITQELYAFSTNSSTDTKTWRRQSVGAVWGAWYRVRKSEAELDARYAALSHTHLLSAITHTDLPTTVDLNNYKTQGFFHQNSNANAAAGSNYPEDCAGLLEVIVPNATFVYQRYTIYQGFGNRIYIRSYYNGTWSTWIGVGDLASTSYGTLSGQSYANANGGHEKKSNGVLECWVRCSVVPTANAVSGPTWTFPVAFIATPSVQVTASTAATTVQNTSAINEATTSAEIAIYRTNNTTTYIMARATGFWRTP